LKQAGDIMLESAADEMARSIKDLTLAATPDASDLDALGVKPNPPEAQPKRRGRKPKADGTGQASTVTDAASV
jgi:hypothetical protein